MTGNFVVIIHGEKQGGDSSNTPFNQRVANALSLPVAKIAPLLASFPALIKHGISENEAAVLATRLEAIGAEVEVLADKEVGSSATGSPTSSGELTFEFEESDAVNQKDEEPPLKEEMKKESPPAEDTGLAFEFSESTPARDKKSGSQAIAEEPKRESPFDLGNEGPSVEDLKNELSMVLGDNADDGAGEETEAQQPPEKETASPEKTGSILEMSVDEAETETTTDASSPSSAPAKEKQEAKPYNSDSASESYTKAPDPAFKPPDNAFKTPDQSNSSSEEGHASDESDSAQDTRENVLPANGNGQSENGSTKSSKGALIALSVVAIIAVATWQSSSSSEPLKKDLPAASIENLIKQQEQILGNEAGPGEGASIEEEQLVVVKRAYQSALEEPFVDGQIELHFQNQLLTAAVVRASLEKPAPLTSEEIVAGVAIRIWLKKFETTGAVRAAEGKEQIYEAPTKVYFVEGDRAYRRVATLMLQIASIDEETVRGRLWLLMGKYQSDSPAEIENSYEVSRNGDTGEYSVNISHAFTAAREADPIPPLASEVR